MKIPLGPLLALSVLVVLNFTHRIYFNIFTHSLPYGIYIKIEGTLHKGDYAASCLTPEIAGYGIIRGYLAPGNCATGTVPVLKVIKGVPGDHFRFKNRTLELNGHSYRLMDKDSAGRDLQIFYQVKEGVLGKREYFLLSDFVPNSWDSRYWGPVTVEFLLKPLWVFEKY
ncbi:MAG: S26 family signal peptidase [Candidatus Omnitrophica bacterium]|nr:S26 family signal peptidase [Candidatus Omnitrophota bacterium]